MFLRDHPRSRGVYFSHVVSLSTKKGSSPLARGLPRKNRISKDVSGIIPARAGFTLTPLLTRRSPWDHPRSRGVYYCQDSDIDDGQGSSPLARGLRITTTPLVSVTGIIPARAGCTDVLTNGL